jgi:ABC-type sugar transport system permease subunit
MKLKTFFQFSLPSLSTMILLMVFPLAVAIWLSFNFVTFRNIDAPNFVGWRNYLDVLQDGQFWQAFRFTFWVVIVTVPLQMFVGLVVALLLDQVAPRIRGVYITFVLLPFIVVPVVGTLMFKQLFEPSGLVAWFFRSVLDQRFILNETSVKALIFTHAVWYVTPFALITFFAGLQTLPQSTVEASLIDGANRLQQIRYVALPHLESLLVLVALISTMDMYRIFDSVFILSEQNLAYRAETVMVYNFRVGLTVQRLGKANAMAILAVITILIVLIPFLYRTYREQVGTK